MKPNTKLILEDLQHVLKSLPSTHYLHNLNFQPNKDEFFDTHFNTRTDMFTAIAEGDYDAGKPYINFITDGTLTDHPGRLVTISEFEFESNLEIAAPFIAKIKKELEDEIENATKTWTLTGEDATIDAFRIKWGLQNTSNDEIRSIILSKTGMDDDGKLTTLISSASLDYSHAEAHIQVLSRIKYRNYLRKDIVELAATIKRKRGNVK